MKTIARVGIAAALLAVFAAFYYFHLGHYLTLESLKANQASLQAWAAERPVSALGGYFLIYVVATTVSLPGAAILTLAGAALFGWLALPLVSFASSLGATAAFLIARFLLRDFASRKLRGTLEKVNGGIEREGAYYLFTLRLVPAFPFFVINVVMGLTKMKTWVFYVVSQIGMLPGTIAYVNAGTQLGKVTSLRGIVSPPVLVSFAVLGVLPFVAKRALTRSRR